MSGVPMPVARLAGAVILAAVLLAFAAMSAFAQAIGCVAAQGNCAATYQVAPGPGAVIGGSSGNVANGTATATLTAAATGKTAYLAGFQFSSNGATTAGGVTCTVTGLAVGTLSYTVDWTAVGGALPLIVPFNPPQPASAANTNIVASCPGLGTGNTLAAMSAQGYLQ